MDDTRIDAAPTPAHIFAYRAFRSVFVGSPESSPVRPRPTEPQHINDNKENATYSPVRGSRFVTSPVKSKRNAENVPENINLSLTPKKQRTNPVSPTKSILKKPNIPTPRRAELRDVTVTFKDVIMSASPEMARRGSPTRVRSQPDLRNTLATLSSVAVTAPERTTRSASQPEVAKKVDKHHTVSQVTEDVDLDGYMAQTEKEIRRLIKYGQKWREYARRQEDENGRLKALIEDLKRENERLGRKSDVGSENVKPSNTIAPLSAQITTGAKLPKQRDQPFDLDNRSRNKEPEKWKIPLSSFDHEKQRSKSTCVLKKKVAELYLEDAPSADKDPLKLGRQTESRTKHDKNTVKHSSARESYDNGTRQDGRENPPPEEQLPSKHGLRDETEIPPEMSKPLLESSSEGDRKAAARERLRLKRELKVASVRASSAPTARDSRSAHDPAKDVNEESQVDWMAMV